MSTSAIADLAGAFTDLHGRSCWSALYGPSTGRVIQLQFERKLPRAVPVVNDALSGDEQCHDAEFVLYLSCTWRLEQGGLVVCSSGDLERGSVVVAKLLEQVVGKQVANTEVREPSADVCLSFEGGYGLQVFCDEPTGYTNYSLLGPSVVHSVKAPGSVVIEERQLESLEP